MFRKIEINGLHFLHSIKLQNISKQLKNLFNTRKQIKSRHLQIKKPHLIWQTFYRKDIEKGNKRFEMVVAESFHRKMVH